MPLARLCRAIRRLRPRFLAALTGVTLAMLAASTQPARAEDKDPAAEAQKLFRAGREQAKNGNCLAAIRLFQASLSTYPSKGSLFNLALCEDAVGRPVAALTHFQQLLPQLAEDDERLPETRQRMASLGSRIARVVLLLAPDMPADATVELDGSQIPKDGLGGHVLLDPGQHAVVVRAPGREAARMDFTSAVGEQKTLTLRAGQLVSVLARSGPSALPALVVGGVGLAGLTVMAVTGGLALTRKSELEEACPVPRDCHLAGRDLARQGEALSTASTAAAVVGIAGTVSGAVLFALSQAGWKTSARVGPVVWSSGGGVLVGGHF